MNASLASALRIGFLLVWLVRSSRSFFDAGWGATAWRVFLCKFAHVILSAALVGVAALLFVVTRG